jgi:hypothetical protein
MITSVGKLFDRYQEIARKVFAVTTVFFFVSVSFGGVAAAADILTQDIAVSTSSDDAEQQASGFFELTSTDLELVVERASQKVGIRFNGVDIPQGIQVVSAYIQFKVDETSSGAASLRIVGEAADDAPTFSGAQDVFSRIETAAEVLWSPTDWPIVGAAGPDQQTPNIAPIVQEIVNRQGWVAGNSIVILFDGSGKRVAESFDGDAAGAAQLHLEYYLSNQEAPLVDAGLDQSITLPDNSVLDGYVTDDGLPVPPGMVTTNWSQVSGSGTASFADASLISTTASFSTAGTYVLRLSASDGERNSSDELTVIVNPALIPPTINTIAPASGQVATVVVVSGSNFSGAQSVTFNGAPSKFEVLSDSTIHATVPPNASTGAVGVSNQWGTTYSAVDFDFIASPPVMVGAGDIATCSGLEEETARLLDAIPGSVFAAGDLAYDSGTVAQFNNCYDPTWGRHKSRTRPVSGNHEYDVPDATPYYNYFGPAAGDPSKGYYSYDVGSWHIVTLNTECAEIGGCNSRSPQGLWLRQDLANNPSECTLAFMHKPLFSSSENHPAFRDFWQILDDAGAELVVSGHKHNYERFAPQDANGNASPLGVRSFIVGTGGSHLLGFTSTEINSEVQNDNTHGVLKLTLNPGSYDWEFIPIAGQTFTDFGSGTCHQVNQVPFVDAGSDQIVVLPEVAVLGASTYDDGFPEPPGMLTTTWSQLSGPAPVVFDDIAAANTTASFFDIGRYELRITSDDGEHVSSDDVVINVIDEGTGVSNIDVRVSSSLDDVEEVETLGTMKVSSSDLELAVDTGATGSNQTIGMRFNGVAIPAGATIFSARLQFQVDEVSEGAASLSIKGEATDNSPPFSTVDGNLTARNTTSATVPWIPAPWSKVDDAGPDQQTPDLSEVIQEIIDLPGWTSGNSLTVIIDGSGQRVAESYDGKAAAAPNLFVEFLAPVNGAPVVNITGPTNGFSALEGTSVLFSGTANDDSDGDLSANLSWTSSIDGVLGSGALFSTTMSVGMHEIAASVTDTDGLLGNDRRSMYRM